MSLVKRALELPEGSPVRKEILKFLAGTKINDNLEKIVYIGKSKKISSDVFLVKKGKDKSRVRDLDGNELTVLNSQLLF